MIDQLPMGNDCTSVDNRSEVLMTTTDTGSLNG